MKAALSQFVIIAASVGSLQAIGTFSASLDFSSLPSEQGWLYVNPVSSVPETDVFSVNGSMLEMNTMTVDDGHLIAMYDLQNLVDPLLPYSLAFTARVLESAGINTFGFEFLVDNGIERAAIGISTSKIEYFVTRPHTLSTSITTTEFHEYRLEGTPGVGWELFVDDTSIGSGPFGPSYLNRVSFGDGTQDARARGQITSLSFTQVPEPATFTLLGLGSLALVIGRRRGYDRPRTSPCPAH